MDREMKRRKDERLCKVLREGWRMKCGVDVGVWVTVGG